MTITDKQVEALEAVIECECDGLAIPREVLRKGLEAADRAAWRPVEEAPKDGTTVLAAFEGQFSWIMFEAQCTAHYGVCKVGFAPATRFRPLPTPPQKDAE